MSLIRKEVHKRLIVSGLTKVLMITLLIGSLVTGACARAATPFMTTPLDNSLDERHPGQDAWSYTISNRTYFPIVARSDITRFAVIGDYGDHSPAEQDVAKLVKSWHPDLVITTGDNNYKNGEARTIDLNIGQFYSEFIYPYHGQYASGDQSTINRFFPTLGNHDWGTPGAQPYLDYFALPGNERYYDFVWGPIHFFAIDSDAREPDGTTRDSMQATWLRDRLAASTATWKIVYMHHPPFSSGPHGSSSELQWPYKDWGATAILAGHDHTYERVQRRGFPYFVNGLGGKSTYAFKEIVAGSQVRYRADYGAMLVEASCEHITFRFYTRSGLLVDEYTLNSTGA